MAAAKPTPTLVSPSYLGREVFFGPQWIERTLTAANVRPVEVRNGVRFYDESEALPVVQAAAQRPTKANDSR